MRVVLSLAAVLALAVGLNLGTADSANAWCGWRCRTLVPAPVVVVPPVVAVPLPAPIPIARPCGGGCGGAYYYPYYYAYYNSCNAGVGSCYWRRDCWYDAFGRRFCN
jgi:hypothetical protein